MMICLGWFFVPIVVKSFIQVSFFEMQAPIYNMGSYVHDVQLYWGMKTHSKTELIEAGRDLARLNASYELAIKENHILKSEIQRLEKILNLPALPEYRYEIARVVLRDINAFWQQLVIRKGKNYNIQKGATVIYGGGIVGRVKEVYLNSSIVELITSPSFRITARLEEDNRPITFQGLHPRVFNHPIGLIKNVPTDIVIENNEPMRLITTHLGGVFPDGLTIGWVQNLKKDSNGLFQSGEVQLSNRLLELEEVVVILPENMIE